MLRARALIKASRVLAFASHNHMKRRILAYMFYWVILHNRYHNRTSLVLHMFSCFLSKQAGCLCSEGTGSRGERYWPVAAYRP